jgi:Fe-S oxidoreductase/FAD/FMN-containing dehydrogenase
MSLLDQQRARLQDDLRGLVSGEVRCDDVFLQLYAGDAGLSEQRPLGVVRPRTAADVSACVRYAAEKGISIHARGAGSGCAGDAIGPGLVLDFSAHFRRAIRIDAERARVQPGLALERLNAMLRKTGRMIGPAPHNAAVTTVGGSVAVDAAGSRFLRYGSMRRAVQSLQVVLADGEVLELGRESLVDGQSTSAIPRKRELLNGLAALLRANAAELTRPRSPADAPPFIRGCNPADVLGDDYIDAAKLLVGSRGTLALTTEIVLGTEPLPGHRGLALLLFDGLEKAARIVPDLLSARPTACELTDRRHLSLIREGLRRFEQLVPAEAEAALLVELEDDDPLEVRRRVHELAVDVWRHQRWAFAAREAFEDDEMAFYWRLFDEPRPALRRAGPAVRPRPAVEDLSVAPQHLADFLVRAQNTLKRNEVTASLVCHAGLGQVLMRPFLDPAQPDEQRRFRQLLDELRADVMAVGGDDPLARQTDPLLNIRREIKRIFDPRNVFNPGKLADDDSAATLRKQPQIAVLGGAVAGQAVAVPDADPAAPPMRKLVELQLDWEPSRVADAAAACNRCGYCRTQQPDLRMCPLFRCLPAEEASPRAKVNLIRGFLAGSLELELLTSDEFKAVADLCVHCHSCPRECPAGVEVPRLMREGKGAYVAANGLTLGQRALVRLDLLGAMGGLIAPAANWALSNRQMRWLLEKTLGIAQGRKLPRVAGRSFMRRAARRRLTRPARHGGEKVLYFVDVYANYFDPQLAEAAVAVLEHNGASVFVHPRQKQAGMAAIAGGALDYARRLAVHNVALLAEAVRQGYHVVATEPAAALCLKREYPQMLDDDDARLVAENSSDLGGYLWKMHTLGRLQLDFRPLNLSLGYHAPCHLLALETDALGDDLLKLIPGLSVQRVEAGCSGMAGTFGLEHKNLRVSLRAGMKLIARLRDADIHAGATECSTCKIQMEQGTSKPTYHPVKLLAAAYGLPARKGQKSFAEK